MHESQKSEPSDDLEFQPRVHGPRWALVLAALLIAFGIAARVRHYAMDTSFWWDEAMLADNLVRRDASGVLDPLDHRQAAPAGFLLLTKASGEVFGYDEHGLRAVPFAASMVGLLLFGPLAWQVLGWRWALAALAMFAVNMHQIGHAGELKQYSGDSAIAVALLLLGVDIWKHGWRHWRLVLLAALGAAAVWFSHPAIFVLAAIGIALLIKARRERRRADMKVLLLLGGIWLVSFGVHFWWFVRPVSANGDLRAWWHFAFWPIIPRSGPHLMWYRDIPIRMFRYPGGLSMLGLGAAMCIAGIVAWWRRDRVGLALLAGPILLALLASAAGKYPFFERMLMFATAPLVLLIFSGTRFLTRASVSRFIGLTLTVLLLAGPTYYAVANMIQPTGKGSADVKPALTYVTEHWQEGDALAVHWGLHFSVQYYVWHDPDLPPDIRLLPECDPIITMPARQLDWPEQMAELLPTLQERHKRVWVMSGNLSAGVPGHLDGLEEVETYQPPRGASVKLYRVLASGD